MFACDALVQRCSLSLSFLTRLRRRFDLVFKYNVGLKTLLLQGLSESEFYYDLVYKFRKIIGKNVFFYYYLKKQLLVIKRLVIT